MMMLQSTTLLRAIMAIIILTMGIVVQMEKKQKQWLLKILYLFLVSSSNTR